MPACIPLLHHVYLTVLCIMVLCSACAVSSALDGPSTEMQGWCLLGCCLLHPLLLGASADHSR